MNKIHSKTLGALIISLFMMSAFTQYILPQTPITVDERKTDVGALGMGNSGTANILIRNGMLYNPALTGFQENQVELSGVNFFFGTQTLNAMSKTIKRRSDFKNAPVVFHETQKTLSGAENHSQATPRQWRTIQRLDALTMSLGNWVNRVEKTPIGAGFLPGASISRSFGDHHFSISVYGNAAMLIFIRGGEIVDSLLAIRNTIGFQPSQATRIESAINKYYDHSTGHFEKKALPEMEGIGIIDLVYAASYAQRFGPWSFGVTGKAVIRQTAAGLFDSDNIIEPLNEIKKDLKKDKHKFSMDAGAAYVANNGNTVIGIAFQDMIGTEYDMKSGDTLSIKNRYKELPLHRNVRAGIFQRLHPKIHFSADWDDIFDQTPFYKNYMERFHAGIEYRYSTDRWLVIPLRTGWSYRSLTFGFGIHLWNTVFIDYARAKDYHIIPYVQHHLQVRFYYPL